MGIYTNQEMELLKKASVYIENKDNYTEDEKKHTTNQVVEYIMSHSRRNNAINNARQEYESILEKNLT